MCYFYSLLYRKETQIAPVIIPPTKKSTEKRTKSIAESILVKIRDMKPLNAEDMDKLNNLSDDDKMEIIGTYNLVVESIQVLVDSEGMGQFRREERT